MSAPEPSDELLLRYLDRAATPEEEAQVAAKLRLDGQARRRYVRLSHLHALVAEASRGPAVGRRGAWRAYAILAAAACLILGFLLAPVLTRRGYQPAEVTDGMVATLSVQHGSVTVLHDGHATGTAGVAECVPGDEVQVPLGAGATVAWAAGVTVTLEGSARARIGGSLADGRQALLTLEDGAIHADVAHRGHAVLISAGWAVVRDLGTVFSVERRDDAVLVAVSSGRVALESGGSTVGVSAGERSIAPAVGRRWLAASTPPPMPVGTAAWRAACAEGLPSGEPLAIDPHAWHCEPLGVCAVPASSGPSTTVSDGTGAVLGQLPLPALDDSAEAIEGLEALAVVGPDRSWLLRAPRLGADGSLHAAAVVPDVPRGVLPALGGLFSPGDLTPGAPAHALAIALPAEALARDGLAIGDRLRVRAGFTGGDATAQALARCAQRGLVVIAASVRPMLFYDHRMPAALRAGLGPDLRAIATAGIVRLIVPASGSTR